MQRIAVCTACVSILAAAASPSALAQHEVRVPFSDSVWYDCGPEEAVQLEGEYHRRVWEHTDAQGIRHRNITYNLQGVSGTGYVTGDRYVAATNEHSTQKWEYVDDGSIVEVHSILVIRLIRTGAGDDSWLYFSVDAVYESASEDPIEERIRFWSECRG